MLTDIKSLLDIFLDKSKSISRRTAIFVSVICFAIITDYVFNISYNIYVTNKLSNLEKVYKLKIIYKTDTVQYSNLIKIEDRLLKKQHYIDYAFSKIESLNYTDKIIERGNIINNSKARSGFWMLITSNYFLVIIVIMLLFVPFFDKKARSIEVLVGIVTTLIIITIIIIITTWILFQIPLILDYPILNYFLNAIIHTLFIWLFYKMSKDKTNY